MKNSGMKDVLYVVMPAYNEEENIKQVVTAWMEVLKYGSQESRLVIADSGSKDRTHDILLKLKKKYNQLEILEKTNRYHGPKVIALYKYAIEKDADYIFQTDSDGQTDPTEFEGFWRVRNEYDGILGVRRNRGDGKSRAFVEKVVCFLLRIFFGVKVPDANAPFRLMCSEMVKKYIGKLPDDYEIPNVILTAYFVKNKEKILFKDVTFAPRVAGENSINVKKIFKVGMKALKDFLYFRKDMKKKDLKSEKDIFWEKIVVVGLLAVIAGVLVMISSAFPWNGGVEKTDSSVFLTIGKQMKEGLVPYIDTFDHKGPLLYIINFLGVVINETKGIFIFEFMAIFVTLWYMLKIFRLKSDCIWFSSVMTLLLFTPFLNIYFSEGGNLTEQYAMPFIAYALYIFLRYFIDGKVASSKVFLVGMGFMCVLMMRVNMVGVWLVFGGSIIGRSLVRKEFSELWRYIRWFIVGALCVAVPLLVWLAVNGALGAFVNAYIGFNISYSVGGQVNGVVPTILYFIRDTIILLSVCLAVFMAAIKKKDRFMMITYVFAYIVCILATCMSGRISPHYGMVLVPLVVFPFAVLCHVLGGGGYGEAMRALVSLFVISLTFTSWLEVARLSMEALHKEVKNKETINTIDNICEDISKYTDQSDKISVYGNWDYVYLRCNRLPASRYSYQFPIGEIKPIIMDEYFNEIEITKPKVFVVQTERWNEMDPERNNKRVSEFVEANGYIKEQRGEIAGFEIYILKDTKDEQ